MITVCAWKWGKKYTAGHLKRLRSMLSRHLSLPHRIVCITDRPEDVPDGIIATKMRGVLQGDVKCMRRLWLYSDEAKVLGDRLFQIDLDVVITDSIDPIVDRPEDFVIWKSDSNTEHKYAYNATLMLTTPGARRDVWDRYAANPKGVFHAADAQGWWSKTNSDQAIATFILQENPPAVWTQEDGVYAYRVFAGKHGDRGEKLPEGCRIVSFHGPRDPSIPDLQQKSPWIQTHWR